MSLGAPGNLKAKQTHRQSSLGMEADLLRAEAAAALARGVMGVEGEDGKGGLMNFGLVLEAGDRDEGLAAMRETVAEIERIRDGITEWQGGCGGWGGWVMGGEVRWGGEGV